MPVLEIKNVTRSYGSRIAVDNVSLTVEEGEIFGFLGPNGAGKTTLIKALTGLSRADRGEILICGKNIVTEFTQAIANVGAIIESPDMYNHMSGYDNLKYFAAYYKGITNKDIWDTLDLVGMSARAKEKMRKYSLGMRQRLGIAQALLHRPKLLILDEPTNGLDPTGIREIREMLRKLCDERKMSVFVSSHILGEMELMCDRVGIINKGKLIANKSIKELSLDAEGRQKIFVEVDDPAKAADIVQKKLGMRPDIFGDRLRIMTTKDNAAKINKILFEGGITVSGLRVDTPTLESVFIELVNNAGGDEII